MRTIPFKAFAMSNILLSVTVSVSRYCFDGKCKLISVHTIFYNSTCLRFGDISIFLLSHSPRGSIAAHEEGADVISCLYN